MAESFRGFLCSVGPVAGDLVADFSVQIYLVSRCLSSPADFQPQVSTNGQRSVSVGYQWETQEIFEVLVFAVLSKQLQNISDLCAWQNIQLRALECEHCMRSIWLLKSWPRGQLHGTFCKPRPLECAACPRYFRSLLGPSLASTARLF